MTIITKQNGKGIQSTGGTYQREGHSSRNCETRLPKEQPFIIHFTASSNYYLGNLWWPTCGSSAMRRDISKKNAPKHHLKTLTLPYPCVTPTNKASMGNPGSDYSTINTIINFHFRRNTPDPGTQRLEYKWKLRSLQKSGRCPIQRKTPLPWVRLHRGRTPKRQ